MNKDFKKEEMYYNGGQALSHNALFTFIIGNRGCGKTYWFRKWVINDFIKNGNQFIYLRRYKEEMTDSNKKNFLSPLIKNNEFPNHELKIKNNEIFVDGKVAGYFVTLSTAKVKKSVDYPLVTKICFDEFIIEKSNYTYIPNEVISLMEFYNTVDRDSDRVKMIFLSNAISIANPYFLEFDINVSDAHRYWKFRNGEMLVDYVDNEVFKEYKRNTRFGRMIAGTKYAQYSIENKFMLDDDFGIDKKDSKCTCEINIKYGGTIYGIWRSRSKECFFISQDYSKTCLYNYCFKMNDITEKFHLVNKSNPLIKFVVKDYKKGNVLFESSKIKAIWQELFKTLL